MSRTSSGFTLIELLVVVAIIGIVAAIAVPGLLNAIDRGRQSATMADIQVLGGALERYALDHQRFPESADVLALRSHLEPEYLKRVPTTDGWQQLFEVRIDADAGSYTIRSLGKDGVAQMTPPTGVTHSFADDIVFSDGAFLQRPVGSQD